MAADGFVLAFRSCNSCLYSHYSQSQKSQSRDNVGRGCEILGVVLTLAVLPISQTAALLLLPYVIWGAIGTYTTWEMIDLNPEAA